MSGWTALSLLIPDPLEDRILLALHEAGTRGLRMDTGPPREGAQLGVAYFEGSADLAALVERLAAIDPTIYRGMLPFANEPWVERQAAGRAPLIVGRSLRILPGPLPVPAPDTVRGRITLLIPPRRAFGTGEHDTTRLCLERLEEEGPLAGRSVLDFGCGSGILGIAAARLGAARVLALDEDPEAIEIARENLVPNRIDDSHLTLVVGGLEAIVGTFDLVIANIYAGVLERAAAGIRGLQSFGGRAILSGFAPDEAGSLARAYAAQGYREIARACSGEWCALVLVRTRARA